MQRGDREQSVCLCRAVVGRAGLGLEGPMSPGCPDLRAIWSLPMLF